MVQEKCQSNIRIKGDMSYVFRFLQDQGIQNVMYKPSKNDFNLYWAKDNVIVTDMISETPIRTNKPNYIMLEKMLVDMSADKLNVAYRVLMCWFLATMKY